MIRTRIYLFLLIAVFCEAPFLPGIAADYGDATDRTSAGDSRDYKRRQEEVRDRRRREDRREEEADTRHRDEEKADENRRNDKYRSDDQSKGAEAVSDDDARFGGKRKTLDDNFDGSRFKPPSFAGDDFHMSTFDDMDKEMRKYDDRSNAEGDDSGPGKHLLVIDEMDVPGRRLDEQEEHGREKFLDLTHRHDVMPGQDWSPSKMDPESNGGFGSADDNGSPVPYHLNGHPNLQRRPAWEATGD